MLDPAVGTEAAHTADAMLDVLDGEQALLEIALGLAAKCPPIVNRALHPHHSIHTRIQVALSPACTADQSKQERKGRRIKPRFPPHECGIAFTELPVSQPLHRYNSICFRSFFRLEYDLQLSCRPPPVYKPFTTRADNAMEMCGVTA